MNIILPPFRHHWLEPKVTLAVAVLAFCAVLGTTKGSPAMTNAAPGAPSSATAKVQDASAPVAHTPPTPPAPAKADKADSDDSDHSFRLNINTDDDKPDGAHTGVVEEIMHNLIPLAGIVATFGTPVLIVFFVCYFKYRRRQDNLAMAREYLNKGLTVPPELLNPSASVIDPGYGDSPSGRPRTDFRKGCKLTFIGLGVTLAFYIDSPHSTTWGWGLIPTVMGLGYLLSAFIENRQSPPSTSPRDYPGPGSSR